jgi:hypothetical protein
VWLRAALFAATAVIGGVKVGRSVMNRAVKSKVDQAIEIAKLSAIDDLSRETTAVVWQRVQRVMASLLWKTSIVAGLFALHAMGELTGRGFRAIVIVVTAGFAVRDAWLFAPLLWRGVMLVRSHKWKPTEALKEFIAGIVFERAYEKAIEAMSQPGTRHAIALSSFKKEVLSEEIANAVTDVAKAASIRIIRARALLGAGAILIFTAAYSAFIYLSLSRAHL